MTSREWKNLTNKEKELYKKGYVSALEELNLNWKEKETKVQELKEYLKTLEEME